LVLLDEAGNVHLATRLVQQNLPHAQAHVMQSTALHADHQRALARLKNLEPTKVITSNIQKWSIRNRNFQFRVINLSWILFILRLSHFWFSFRF
jgi:hypothetical protein